MPSLVHEVLRRGVMDALGAPAAPELELNAPRAADPVPITASLPGVIGSMILSWTNYGVEENYTYLYCENGVLMLGTHAEYGVIADYRSNSVIVQAAPRDLAEVAFFIQSIDRDRPEATHEIRVFRLQHALAGLGRRRSWAQVENRGVDVAGEDRAGADAVGALLGVDRLGQAGHAELGDHVGYAGLGVGAQPGLRDNIDDCP